MAAKTPERRRIAGTIAAIERHNGPADPRIEPLRGELAAESLADHIRRVVDSAPPLTAETRARLAVILLAPAGDSDAT